MGKVIVIALGLALAFLAVVLIRFNLKRLHVIKRAAAATDAQLERVYRAVESINTEPPTCAVLARTNRTAPSRSAIVPIPEYVQPWAGRSIVVTNVDQVELSLSDVAAPEPAIAGKIFRTLAVPRQQTRTARAALSSRRSGTLHSTRISWPHSMTCAPAIQWNSWRIFSRQESIPSSSTRSIRRELVAVHHGSRGGICELRSLQKRMGLVFQLPEHCCPTSRTHGRPRSISSDAQRTWIRENGGPV